MQRSKEVGDRELEMFYKILVMRQRFHGMNGSKPAAKIILEQIYIYIYIRPMRRPMTRIISMIQISSKAEVEK